jgi:hypothetical protein
MLFIFPVTLSPTNKEALRQELILIDLFDLEKTRIKTVLERPNSAKLRSI